jgi:hypothetical protein
MISISSWRERDSEFASCSLASVVNDLANVGIDVGQGVAVRKRSKIAVSYFLTDMSVQHSVLHALYLHVV